jgi:predicted Rossmann-fold nucleotide-binding protein
MPDSDPDRIRRFRHPEDAVESIRRDGRRVVTFVGFSGRGYDDPALVERLAEGFLDELEPSSTIVCSGATEEGIGVVYRLAKARGFTTIGIVSSLAQSESPRLAADVDTIYVIDDDSWGGRRRDGTLSPTSAAMVESADAMIAIGGGDVARDEIEAVRKLGKPVRYAAADMNHAAAVETAQTKAEPKPTDFKGPVHALMGCGR